MMTVLAWVFTAAVVVGWLTWVAVGIGRACDMGDEIAAAQAARRLEGGQP